MQADPQIEYLPKPSMHYRRFGNRISYNAYSIRSGPVTLHKTDPAELRVLVIGDSVVNGGRLRQCDAAAPAAASRRDSSQCPGPEDRCRCVV
jgi:hypothetical protein